MSFINIAFLFFLKQFHVSCPIYFKFYLCLITKVFVCSVYQALILNTATVPAVDKKGVTRGYMANDLVCVVVSEVNVEAERVVAVMNVPAREGQAPHPPMGLIHSDDLPEAYK